MLDIALIRAQPDEVKQRLARLHDPDAGARVDRILELDTRRRELLAEAESLQAQRNRLNRALGKLRGDRRVPEGEKTARLIAATRQVQEARFDEAFASLQHQMSLPGMDELDVSGRPDSAHQMTFPGLSALDDAMQSLVTALRGMSERHSAWQTENPAM